jgi:hypothetical protein
MSAPTPQTPAQPATATAATTAQTLPNPAVLTAAAKLALAQDKPILLDYYVESATGGAFMGEDKETKDRMLIKSADEFTSMIQKTYKAGEDYIVMTENSIYVVSGKITKRGINAGSLRQE